MRTRATESRGGSVESRQGALRADSSVGAWTRGLRNTVATLEGGKTTQRICAAVYERNALLIRSTLSLRRLQSDLVSRPRQRKGRSSTHRSQYSSSSSNSLVELRFFVRTFSGIGAT